MKLFLRLPLPLFAVIAAALVFAGCRNDSTVTTQATAVLKSDGSHFTGKVVRQDDTSITITAPDGITHTYLLSDLSKLSYGAAESVAPTEQGESNAVIAAIPTSSLAKPLNGVIFLPPGTKIPVRNIGVLDSCCLPIASMALGKADANVLDNDGRIAIPAGAAVTILVREKARVNTRVQMVFELGSVDFGTRHFVVRSAKGAVEPGAIVTFIGAAPGSAESKVGGENVHLGDGTAMDFKAETGIEMREPR